MGNEMHSPSTSSLPDTTTVESKLSNNQAGIPIDSNTTELVSDRIDISGTLQAFSIHVESKTTVLSTDNLNLDGDGQASKQSDLTLNCETVEGARLRVLLKRSQEEFNKPNETPSNLPRNFTQTPLILTAEPHITHDPTMTITTTTHKTTPPTPNPLSSTTTIISPRPLKKKAPTPIRPPPSTPPEPATYDELSTPTLPSLHPASTPALIEQYRIERRHDPTRFDAITRHLHASLVQAKIERGGVAVLLENEYTAQLASRLDAAVVEWWGLTAEQGECGEICDCDDESDASE